MYGRFILFLLVLIQIEGLVQANNAGFVGLPPMVKYTAEDFGTNSQVWATIQDQDGLIYIASTAGIKQFDGERWVLIADNYIQAFLKNKDRIYAGGFESIGYIAQSADRIQFHSLSHLIPEESQYTVIRNIHRIGSEIFFVAHELVFVFNEESETMSTIPSEQMLYPSQKINNKIIIKVDGKGLLELKGKLLIPIKDGERCANENIARIEPLKEGNFMTLSSQSGHIEYTKEGRQKTNLFDHPYYQSKTLFHSTQLKNGNFALSFLTGGFVLTDPLLNPLLILDELTEVGAQVHHVYEDDQNDLWISTNEGLVYLNLSSPLSYVGKNLGLEGAINGSLIVDNEWYLSSYSGVYHKSINPDTDPFSPKRRSFQKIKDSPVSAMAMIKCNDGQLFSTHNSTKGIIKDHEFTALLTHNNTYHSSAIYDSDQEIIITNNVDGKHLEIFKRMDQKWQHSNTIFDDRLPIHLSIFTLYDPISKYYWVDPPFDEPTYRFKLNEKFDQIIALEFIEDKVLPIGQLKPFLLENNLYFATSNGLYYYNSSTDEIKKDPRFKDHFDDIGLITLTKVAQNKYWYQSNDFQVMGEVSVDTETSNVNIDNDRFSAFNYGSLLPYIHALPDQSLAIGTLNGVYLSHPDHPKESHEFKYRPAIRSVRIIQEDSIIHHGHHVDQKGAPSNSQQLIPALGHHQNSLQFTFATPFFKGGKSLLYKTKLNGFDEKWSAWSSALPSVYTNLPSGEYSLDVQTKNAFGKTSEIGEFKFKILLPWHQTWWAYLACLLLLIGFIRLIVILNAKRLKAENEQLEETIKDRVREIQEQKSVIAQSLIEKESLLKEIHHRVKNNLQIIANLLYLQSNKVEDENFKNVLEEGQGRVRSMALIHQKLYENEDLKSIPFGEYVLELVNEIKASFGDQAANVNINVDAKEAFFDVDSAVPLGLIINELSTNAFKYAFEGRDEGQFNIFLTKSGDEYELHISDNGRGLPETIDIRKTRSLGLRLVRILSDQLEGEYSFKSEGGMSFTLKFVA